MFYAGILPFAFYNNEIYFLLGRERYGSQKNMYSDFGGEMEKGESVLQAAAREGYEELFPLGKILLGNSPKEIARKMCSKNFTSTIIINSPLAKPGRYPVSRGRHYLFLIKYNPKLPQIFSKAQQIKLRKFHKHKKEYFEKDKIKWVKATSMCKMKNLRPEFREDFFYESSRKCNT